MSELDTKLATPRSGTGAFYRPMSERAIDSALDHQVPDHHVEPDQVCGCGWVYVGVGAWVVDVDVYDVSAAGICY